MAGIKIVVTSLDGTVIDSVDIDARDIVPADLDAFDGFGLNVPLIEEHLGQED